MLKLGALGLVGFIVLIWFMARPPEVSLPGNPDFVLTQEILHYRGKPFNGVTKELFPDGSVFRRTHYKQGLKEGAAEEFGFTGARRALWNYAAGKKEGWQQGWYIEGPSKFKMHYRAGLLDGVTTEWYLDGHISRQQTYRAGVELAQKVLYPTGEIFSNYVIRDRRKYGLNTNDLCMDSKKDGELR